MDLISKRQIRVFISSTFQDMQAERDYLICTTFPLLRELAEKRNVSLVEIDLRWGVTEEEARDGRTVDICLQEIENSHPFFIGIVGNRYGWCPKPTEIADIDDLDERFNGVRSDFESGLSVTEVEMQYGVLRRKDTINASFFIKDDFTPVEDDVTVVEKLKRLRENIESNNRYPVYHYHSPEQIGRGVYEEFVKLLDRLFPIEDMGPYMVENVCQASMIESKCDGYVSEQKNFDVINSFLDNKNENYLLVTSDSGMGKSSLVANWISEYSKKCGWQTFYHFVGAGNDGGDYRYVCKSLSYQISKFLGLTFQSGGGDVVNELSNLIKSTDDKKLIIIDGINQLFDIENAKTLNWLPFAGEQTKILITSLEDDQTSDAMRYFGAREFKLGPIDIQNRKALIGKYLKRYGKRLNDKQIDSIVSARISQNTFVLRTILQELKSFGKYEELNSRIALLTEPESIDDFYSLFLNLSEEHFGHDVVRAVLSLIEVSRNGLTENEIRTLVGLKPVEWSQMYCFFKYFFSSRSEGISISHQYLRNAIENKYLDENTDEEHFRKKIIALFEKRDNERAWKERAHQYYLVGDDEHLLKEIIDLNHFAVLFKADRYRFNRYWKTVNAETGTTPLEYLKALDSVLDIKERIIFNLMIVMFLMEDYSDMSIALPFAEKCKELCENNTSSNAEERKAAYNNLGLIHKYLGNSESSLEYMMKAVEIDYLNDSVSGYAKTFGITLSNIGILLSEQNRFEESLDFLFRAREKNKIEFTIHSGYYINNCSSIASVYDSLGNEVEAERYFQEALSLAGETYGLDSLIYAYVCKDYGYSLLFKNEPDKSIIYLEQAIKVFERTWGKTHRLLSAVYCNLSEAYRQKGEMMRALEFAKDSLDNALTNFGENHYETSACYLRMGELAIEAGSPENGREFCLKALEIRLGIEPGKKCPVMKYLNAIAKSSYMMEDYNSALTACERMLEVAESEDVSDGELDAIRDNIARLKAQLG